MMEGMQSEERVEGLIGREDEITDTIPEPIFEAVVRYYERCGYRLQRFILVSADTYEATFTRED